MSKLDLINQTLTDLGFIIEDVRYTFEKVSYNHMVINGRHHTQEQKQIFTMLYIGDACEVDDDHNDLEGTEMCGFDILDENEYPFTTIFIEDANDLRFYFRLW